RAHPDPDRRCAGMQPDAGVAPAPQGRAPSPPAHGGRLSDPRSGPAAVWAAGSRVAPRRSDHDSRGDETMAWTTIERTVDERRQAGPAPAAPSDRDLKSTLVARLNENLYTQDARIK